MTSSNPVHVPQWLVHEGVSIIGTGVMGAAYVVRLSRLGIPVTIFNRTAAKATALAAAHENVKVAATVADCARATPNVLVACSPAPAAVAAVCEQLSEVVRDRHVTFVVDTGLPQAKLMENQLFDRAGAASVTNAALFGTAFAVMDGSGTLINASGRERAVGSAQERVLPLLGLFGAAAYHPGGTVTASWFAMAGHLAFMPIFYALMHYVALMRRSGIDGQTAVQFFQTTGKVTIEQLVPLLASMFEKHDYSAFFGSHRLVKDIYDCLAETCRGARVDDGLARLMASYHERALEDPRLATTPYHAAYDVIAEPRA